MGVKEFMYNEMYAKFLFNAYSLKIGFALHFELH